MKNLFSGMLLATETAKRIVLKLPNGVPLRDSNGVEAFISVLSTDSRKANALRQAARDARREMGTMSSAQIEEEGVNILANLSTDWYLVNFDGTPLVGEDGNKLPFSIENAKVLYSMPEASIWTDQVKVGSGERGNFMPAPASA